MVHLIRRLLYWKWALNSRICREVSIPSGCKATVVLTAYREERMGNLDPLARSVLKCAFVEKVIVSNDNPRLRIADWVGVRDERLVLLDQPVRRGCKYRWELARAENAAYYLAIDDDVLVYPRQLARLFMHLINRQEVPHGLSGCRFPFRFLERKELEVDLLFEIYAVTREHLRVYFDYLRQLEGGTPGQGRGIDMMRGDFVVISHCGKGKPLIHDAGFISRCATAYAEGVATFREHDFLTSTEEVIRAVEQVKARTPHMTA
jgi:hypothetical protein